MKVLITGANGFLGRHVVAEALRRGLDVRALVRPAAAIDRLPWASQVEVARHDLRASRDLAGTFDGVDALIHLAAGVKGTEDAQFAASVVGTERLLEAMATSGTRRLTLASSFSVYDWSAIRGELTEESPVEPSRDLYARDGYAVAKVWQERVATRLAAENHWDLTVLRPGFIWGEGNAYLAGLGQKLGATHLGFGGSTRLPLTHVENCAHCFVETTVRPEAVGQVFNVVDDEGMTVAEYLDAYLAGTGEAGRGVMIPYGLAFSGVRMAQWISRRLFRGKGKLPSILVPSRFEARFKPLRFGNAKLRRVLGWSPPLGPAERIARTYPKAQAPAAEVGS